MISSTVGTECCNEILAASTGPRRRPEHSVDQMDRVSSLSISRGILKAPCTAWRWTGSSLNAREMPTSTSITRPLHRDVMCSLAQLCPMTMRSAWRQHERLDRSLG
jgi:hypothetical protein